MAEITSIREIDINNENIKIEFTYLAQYNRGKTYFNNLDFDTAEGESDDSIEYLKDNLDDYLDHNYLDFTKVAAKFFEINEECRLKEGEKSLVVIQKGNSTDVTLVEKRDKIFRCVSDIVQIEFGEESQKADERLLEKMKKLIDFEMLYSLGIREEDEKNKKAFDELGVKKLPTVKSLQVEFAEQLTAKKEAYAELKKVRDELRALTVHNVNYEELRDLEEREKRKEKEHGRE